jgi:sporulation protein YlmC with PRC-barrel domain
MLVGKDVYGLNENSVGTIDDLILDDEGKVANVIIDFGGFLGMGTSQVSIGYDELTVLANDGRADVRVYVDATKEEVQAQPKYSAEN